jgi:hypothetical protein
MTEPTVAATMVSATINAGAASWVTRNGGSNRAGAIGFTVGAFEAA